MVGGGCHAAEHDPVVACNPLQGSRMGEVRADIRARGKRARLEFRRARGAAGGASTLGAMKLDLVASAFEQQQQCPGRACRERPPAASALHAGVDRGGVERPRVAEAPRRQAP